MILSEQTKEMSIKDIEKYSLNADKNMSDILDPDMMGFWGKEGVDDED